MVGWSYAIIVKYVINSKTLGVKFRVIFLDVMFYAY